MPNFEIIDSFEKPSPREVAHAPEVLPLPGADVSFDIRPATVADIPWIDGLQKQSTRSLGFWSFEMLKGYLEKGNVWVAVAAEQGSGQGPVASDQTEPTSDERVAVPDTGHSSPATGHSDPAQRRLGYCIAADKYFKREDTGIIYQMNIAPAPGSGNGPGGRRKYIASNFLQRVWDTWPWGVKLCGLWCAQDLEANKFWEKCGFKAIAFRAGGSGGSSKKTVKNLDGSTSGGRVHIYWQKRIRANDATTPHWFPSQTGGGAIREDRVVFPIPPEVHWSQAAPRFLPGVHDVFEAMAEDREVAERETLELLAPPPPPEGTRKTRQEKAELKRERDAARAQQAQRSTTMADGGLSFARPAPPAPEAEAEAAAHAAQADSGKRDKAAAKKEAKQAGERAAAKNHPVLVNLARELRDRWVEAATPGSALEARLLGVSDGTTYDVTRQVGDASGAEPTVGMAVDAGRHVRRVENHAATRSAA